MSHSGSWPRLIQSMERAEATRSITLAIALSKERTADLELLDAQLQPQVLHEQAMHLEIVSPDVHGQRLELAEPLHALENLVALVLPEQRLEPTNRVAIPANHWQQNN